MATAAQPPYPRPVYIVEQDPSGQASTIHISQGVNRDAESQNKTGTFFTTTGGQPGQGEKPALEEKNPVELRYDQLTNARIGRWLSAAIVLGLAAGVISKHPGSLLLAASAVNIAIVSPPP